MNKTQEEFSFYNLFVPLTTKKAILYIILISFFLFFFGVFNGFVGDDNTQIIDNPTIQSLQNFPKFFLENRLLTSGNNSLGAYYYRPMHDLYFAVTYAFSGPNPVAFHLFQTILYVVNVCIIYFLFKKFFGIQIAFVLSLIFLVHPVNDEEMFYISATQETLFFLFGIVSLYILTKYENLKDAITVFFLLFLSLLSKETGILFVLINFLYVFMFRKKIILPTISFSILVIAAYTILRTHAVGILSNPVANAPIQKLSFYERMITVPAIVFFYIQKVIFPMDLSSSWQWVYRSVNTYNFFLPLVIDLFILGILIFSGYLVYKKNKFKKTKNHLFFLYLFFLTWFISGLLLHLQLIPLDQTVAERWFYFPLAGVMGIIGVILKSYNVNLTNRWVATIIVLIIALFSMRSFARSLDYKNDFTLASHDINISPDSYNLEYILSHIYYEQGNLPLATIHAMRSVKLFPYITNYTNLGATYSRMGDYPRAKQAYLTAIKYGNDSLPYENLTSLSLAYGNSQQNIDFIKNNALSKYPKNGMMWYTLSILEYTKGDKVKAIEDIAKAKLYYKNPNVEFISNVIKSKKKLDYKIQNGAILFIVTDN